MAQENPLPDLSATPSLLQNLRRPSMNVPIGTNLPTRKGERWRRSRTLFSATFCQNDISFQAGPPSPPSSIVSLSLFLPVIRILQHAIPSWVDLSPPGRIDHPVSINEASTQLISLDNLITGAQHRLEEKY